MIHLEELTELRKRRKYQREEDYRAHEMPGTRAYLSLPNRIKWIAPSLPTNNVWQHMESVAARDVNMRLGERHEDFDQVQHLRDTVPSLWPEQLSQENFKFQESSTEIRAKCHLLLTPTPDFPLQPLNYSFIIPWWFCFVLFPNRLPSPGTSSTY